MRKQDDPMNIKFSCVFFFAMATTLFGTSPLLWVADIGPNMLEIVHAPDLNNEVHANVTQAQLVRNIYHTLLSLPVKPADKTCPMYVTAQYQLTFLRGSSSLLKANVQQGGCSTVSLGLGNLRATTRAFWLLLGRTNALGNAHAGSPIPDGLGPDDLQHAYGLPSAIAGKNQTVAIVDAYDDPSAEADMAVYRATFGLPACTSAQHCFQKVDEYGKGNYPSADAGWAAEIALDLDMVSATCPLCHILLVEASSASLDKLGAAVDTAVRLGATVVSNSYGVHENSLKATTLAHYYTHPGVAIVASSGDDGYRVQLPAAFAGVVAVGGTTLSRANNTRGWTESVWGGSGSGCSQYISKPKWQHDHQCTFRSVADVAAVADPDTGVAIYNTYQSDGQWFVEGGTSASSPIIAGVYALAGNAAHINASYLYQHTRNLHDVVVGNNGTCSVHYLCNAGPGYDGPTGMGTPNGLGAF